MFFSSCGHQIGHLRFDARPRRDLALSLLLLLNLLFIDIVTAISDHPLLLIVSFDGFRYDYLDNDTMRTPNLDALMANGVRAPWMQPRYISKTFPNHFSIATGMHEESHGIVGNSFFDPLLNETFDMSHLEAKWWDVGGLPLWVLNQMTASDRYSGSIMWPGADARIRNQTAHHRVAYNAHIPWKERVDTAIQWFKRDSEPANLVYLYFHEPDNTSHWYGPESVEVIESVELMDRNVGYLQEELRRAGLFDSVHLIITSDHGMTDIPKENNLFMSDFVDVSLFKAFGGSPVWNVLPDEGYEQEVYDAFLNASKYYNFTVYEKEDIPESYYYQNNRRIMPIVVSMDEHFNLDIERTGPPRTTTTGNHGYNNTLMSMQTIFVAHGPQFKQGFVSKPFDNVDIFPLGCHLLGIVSTPNNASMEVVKSLLRNYPVLDLEDKIFAVISLVLFFSVLVAVVAIVRLRMRRVKIRKMKRKVRERSPARMFDDENVDAAEEDHRLLFDH